MHPLEEKIKRLVKPKGYACFPVLITTSGITSDLEERDYLFKHIDLIDFIS